MGRTTHTKPPSHSRKHCILVISSDIGLCATVEAAREPNCKVVRASDGQSGLTLFQRQKPHLVILDETLPDIAGLAVLEQIRSHTPHASVIIVSTSNTIAAAFTFMKAGADDFFTRPLERVHLQIAMRKANSPRPEDNPRVLVNNLISKYALETQRHNVKFTPEAINALVQFATMAGSQKLEDLIAQVVTIDRRSEITAKDLSGWIDAYVGKPDPKHVKAIIDAAIERGNYDAKDTKKRHWC